MQHSPCVELQAQPCLCLWVFCVYFFLILELSESFLVQKHFHYDYSFYPLFFFLVYLKHAKNIHNKHINGLQEKKSPKQKNKNN